MSICKKGWFSLINSWNCSGLNIVDACKKFEFCLLDVVFSTTFPSFSFQSCFRLIPSSF